MSLPTLYVAGPMNYPAFDDAADRLRDAGYSVLNPTDTDPADYPDYDGTTPPPWEWWLRQALRMVLEADGIAVLPGWEGSRGARLEVYVGRSLDMPWRTVADWLDRAERAS